MRTFEYTWKAFWIRQLKTYALVAFIFTYLWNAVAIGEWAYALFDSTLIGYGEPQQRWYRVLAFGFFIWGLIITLLDLINTSHYLKNPDEIPTEDGEGNG